MSTFQKVMDAIIQGFRGILTFRGRTSQLEFWSFSLVMFLFYAPLVSLLVKLQLVPVGFAGLLFMLGLIAASVRRLHDNGISGWWATPLFLSPVIGGLTALIIWGIYFILFLLPSDDRANRFGPDPALPGTK